MKISSSILLGLIQGAAEFLPVSSSGHLAIAEKLLGMQEMGDVPPFFDVLLHLGTLLAVFVFYWGDVREMVLEFFRGVGDVAHHRKAERLPPARRMILLLVLGTLPLFLVLPVKDYIESLGDDLRFVGGALIVTGVVLFLSDRVRKGRKTEKTATVLDVLTVGLAQAIATCPGISRSGMTISTGCFMGFDRRFAVRFSFLLSIPAVLGANLLALVDAVKLGVDWSALPVYLLGVAVAAVVGYLCLSLLRFVAERGRFGGFALYCMSVGVLVLVFGR